MVERLGITFAVGLAIHSSQLAAQCTSLVKGAMAIDVLTCHEVNPPNDFSSKEDMRSYRDLTAKDKTKFLNTYRGKVIKGTVAFSKAIRSGLSTEKGALNGETVTIFIEPDDKKPCQDLQAKRVAGVLEEICCSGGIDPPCLLDTSFVLRKATVIGKEKSSAGNVRQKKSEKSNQYQMAMNFMRQKNYSQAARYFELARKANELDTPGYYYLGFSYRRLDHCKQAIEPLRVLTKINQANKAWKDEEEYVKKGSILLARCYAKVDRPGEALLILNSYLIEPVYHREEIQESLSNPDFGWINASKGYKAYREKAVQALQQRVRKE